MASLVDVAALINSSYNHGNKRKRHKLLNLLLEFGAPPDGIKGSAVKVTFENRDSSSLSCLLVHGASLEGIERPFHDAFDVALQTGKTFIIVLYITSTSNQLSTSSWCAKCYYIYINQGVSLCANKKWWLQLC